jgi:hypothetical protein
MKYFLHSIILLLVFGNSNKLFSQNIIYAYAYSGNAQHNFDFNDRDTGNYFIIDTNQTNNIWKIGTPSKIVFNSANSAPLAILTDTFNTYPINNTSSFSFTLYTNDLTIINISHRINADSLNDGGVIEYSLNGGNTWNSIFDSTFFTSNSTSSNINAISSNSNKIGFTGTSDWMQFNIGGHSLNNVKFRFTFTSDNLNTNKDGWMIDDISINCIGTGLNNISNEAPIHIFPSPSSDIITIQLNSSRKLLSTVVTNIAGEMVLNTDKMILDVSKLSKGIYFVKVSTDKGNYKSKFIRN